MQFVHWHFGMDFLYWFVRTTTHSLLLAGSEAIHILKMQSIIGRATISRPTAVLLLLFFSHPRTFYHLNRLISCKNCQIKCKHVSATSNSMKCRNVVIPLQWIGKVLWHYSIANRTMDRYEFLAKLKFAKNKNENENESIDRCGAEGTCQLQSWNSALASSQYNIEHKNIRYSLSLHQLNFNCVANLCRVQRRTATPQSYSCIHRIEFCASSNIIIK